MKLGFPLAPARQALLAWYRAGARSLPWRELFREHGDPYHVWVSEIMLQQTVIKAVLPVYARFLARFPDASSVARASEAEVREAVRGLGYYRRFRLMREAAQALAGKPWPRDFEGWKALPGIGNYTAAAIASIAYGYPSAVLDGNVERVLSRLVDSRAAVFEPGVKKKLQAIADTFLDAAHPGDFNQALMELGQLVCTPTSPACGSCPLTTECLARERGSQTLAPGPKKRAETVDVAMRLTVVRDGAGRVALWERPQTARFLKGTWGFEAPASATLEVSALRVALVRHTITKHKIRAEVHCARVKRGSPPEAKWLAEDEVERHLVSNLDRKAWLALRALEVSGTGGHGHGHGHTPPLAARHV